MLSRLAIVCTALVTVAAGAAALASAAGADSKDGGKLSIKTSKRVISYGASANAADEYTITVRGQTPSGSSKVRVYLTSSRSACPASAGNGFVLSESPAGGRSFKYSKPLYNAEASTPGVEHWCAYASFTRSGQTVSLRSAVKVTLSAAS